MSTKPEPLVKGQARKPPSVAKAAAAAPPLSDKDKPKIDPNLLRRTRPTVEPDYEPEPLAVSAGAVDKIIDLAFNPSREKIREVTIIDRLQGRFFPQLDMVNTLRHYVLEIAFFRQDKEHYLKVFKRPKPMPPDCTDELLYRIAQWQKSITGKNLDRALDIALAETETKSGDDDMGGAGGTDVWKE